MIAVMAPSPDGGIVQVSTVTTTYAKPSTFWHGKTVCVTGGAGFVGSHLVDLLVEAGAGVTIIDNLSRGQPAVMDDGIVLSGLPLDPRANLIYGDVGDEGTCRDNFKVGQDPVDVVFNLAAHVAGVIYNQSHHYEMFAENLRVLSTPLKVAAEYGVGRFLQTSSVCVYSPDHNHPCQEPHGHDELPTPANEGYSWAKRIGEHLARWTAQETDLHTVIVRPSNVFGPRDWFDDKAHVVPALIEKVLSNDVVKVYGTGHEQREFIYVTDIARGMMKAVENGESGEVYNLGTSGQTCVSIRQLLDMIQEVCGTDKPVRFSSEHDPGDKARWSDAVRANTELDWMYEVGLEEGIKRTVEWYKESLE